VDVDGLRFVADSRFHLALAGVVIDVQDFYGREALVAYRDGLGGC
jgi:hypothetical protein